MDTIAASVKRKHRYLAAMIDKLKPRLEEASGELQKQIKLVQRPFDDHIMRWMEFYKADLSDVETAVRVATRSKADDPAGPSEMRVTMEFKRDIEDAIQTMIDEAENSPIAQQQKKLQEDLAGFLLNAAIYYKCEPQEINWDTGEIKRGLADEDQEDDTLRMLTEMPNMEGATNDVPV